VAPARAKSGFLATMSHEIRTPINAVIGYHELLALELDGPLTAGQRGHLARASASARHLLGLVSEVLDFSRLEASRSPCGTPSCGWAMLSRPRSTSSRPRRARADSTSPTR
jgi:signal transduction histidine kinase